ncbi:Nucleoside triphosphate pyrophosphohydrolase [bioreactor metagenome]|uniref:Nucleoside triphosphate pyrophosphohydrolase n=2 Tax=root TaxID=1 RepID=A0A644YNM7_9ZZZZ
MARDDPRPLRAVPSAPPGTPYPQLDRFVEVMGILRQDCPWDAGQTHRSLVQYLVEETMETVEAIETGDPAHLREELGDLLLQVVFHATIAAEPGGAGFDLDDVARGVADKLIARHPYIFATEDVPEDLDATWEQRKRRLKGRTSTLDGIPQQLSAMHRASKVIGRAASHDVDLAGQGVALPTEAITAEELGRTVLGLVSRARASGLDPEQVTRDALRDLEQAVVRAEAAGQAGPGRAVPDTETDSEET